MGCGTSDLILSEHAVKERYFLSTNETKVFVCVASFVDVSSCLTLSPTQQLIALKNTLGFTYKRLDRSTHNHPLTSHNREWGCLIVCVKFVRGL